ncbi:MAG: hypothetical protein WBP44_15905 [Gammaproteobacteria bacterium]|jgi:hypothetical protein
MNTSSLCAHNDYPNKHVCPVNGQVYASVNRRTVLHQVKIPWARQLPEQGYYFCTDPDCDVVYFGEDARVLMRDELRMPVGQKSSDPERPICYCFDIRAVDVMAEGAGTARQFVIDHTRDASCDCEIRNPSGRCCLKDFSGQ